MPSGFLTDTRNNKMLLLVGYAASIIAFIGYGIAPNVGVIIVFRIFGQSIAQASLQGQVMKDAGPEQRGVASSTFFMGIDIGQGLGAIVGGALIDLAGFEGAFLFGPVALAASLVAYLYWLRTATKHASRS